MVSTSLMRIVSPCWKPSVEGENSSNGGDAAGRAEGLLWYKDSGQHVNGEFSMAVIQANNLLEDYSQLESGPMSSVDPSPQGTFVGVYDGHGGPEAARFVNERLFENIKTIHGAEFTSENNGMSADVINKAFLATEEEFLSLVKNQWLHKPQIASVGACCLVGVVCSGVLYIANAGDSRAVLGRLERAIKEIKAIQLSYEHNASIDCCNNELQRQGLYRCYTYTRVTHNLKGNGKRKQQRTSVHSTYSVVPNHEIREGGHGLIALEAQNFFESVSRHCMNHP